jgi:hypothetical protein
MVPLLPPILTVLRIEVAGCDIPNLHSIGAIYAQNHVSMVVVTIRRLRWLISQRQHNDERSVWKQRRIKISAEAVINSRRKFEAFCIG